MFSTPQHGPAGTISFASLAYAFAVAMKKCSAQYLAFIVETSFKNGNSFVKTPQIFHKDLNIARHKKILVAIPYGYG
jgi:hypothetical protein